MKKTKIIGPGSSNVDLTGFAPKLPTAGETVMGTRLSIGPGGKGSNQMTAAARAGGDVYFITRLGQDTFGKVLEAHFEREGFRKDHILISDTVDTACALIEIDEADAQNRIMVIPAANSHVGRGEVLSAEADFATCDVVLTQLEINMTGVMAAAELAKKYNKPFILNPAPALPLPEDIWTFVDWFTPNETEVTLYTGVEVNSDEDARKAARVLLDRGVGNVVITLGKRGAYWTNGKDEAIVPGYPVKAVETTGAGDTFNGAFAVALGEGKSPVDALAFANAAAAISVTRHGAAESAPLRDEIMEMMK
ncbi:MAG: ribokinase [Ruminococcaceae bacterium]|nr:ribokinase [Oscillospiraceae bacterium]